MPAWNAAGVTSIPSEARTRGPNTLMSTIRRARSRRTSQARPVSVSGHRSSTKPGLAPVATIGTAWSAARAMMAAASGPSSARMNARSSAVQMIGAPLGATAARTGRTSTSRVAVATMTTSGAVAARVPGRSVEQRRVAGAPGTRSAARSPSRSGDRTTIPTTSSHGRVSASSSTAWLVLPNPTRTARMDRARRWSEGPLTMRLDAGTGTRPAQAGAVAPAAGAT